MVKQIKVVKVPVRVADEDETIRKIKYRALDKVMAEARYLGNMAIRYTIAFRLRDIPREINEQTGEPVPVDTRIYRILSKEKKFIPASPLATLGSKDAPKMVRNSDKDAWAGRKSLPTYRSLFVPFRSRETRLVETRIRDQKQFIIRPDGFGPKWLSDELVEEVAENPPEIPKKQRQLELISLFSWKDQGAAEIVSRIVSGEYKLCDSQMRKYGKDLMVFLTYQFESKETVLNPEKVCGVDLGVVIPAVCAVNDSLQRQYLGDGGDVWAVRSKFRSQRRREQRRKGLYSKSTKWRRSEKEDRWIHTYYHALTRGVIKFCLQRNCGRIHVEDLSRLRKEDMESEFRRLMWVPSKFYNLLEYKAREQGIEVVKVNPQNTSRRCSICGYIDKENRKSQSEFICIKCGEKLHADYNAAKNLALASGEVIEKGYKM